MIEINTVTLIMLSINTALLTALIVVVVLAIRKHLKNK